MESLEIWNHLLTKKNPWHPNISMWGVYTEEMDGDVGKVHSDFNFSECNKNILRDFGGRKHEFWPSY